MFITFEGIEGSGKTTQIHRIDEHLKRKGYDCMATREPGGTEIGQRIRAILLDPQSEHLDPMSELLLYMADRAQHLHEKVKPHITAGKIVLCDRYYDATIAYQGSARALGVDLIRDLHRVALGDFKPDLTLLLDLPPHRGLERAWCQIDNGDRTGNETRFEKEALAFHEKVRREYLKLVELEPQRIKIIDAAQAEDQVTQDILSVIFSFLE